VGLFDTILKGDHQRTSPVKFGLISFCGFRGEDLNVKVDDVGQMDARYKVMTKTHMGFGQVS
jgi:hypothetical protein